MLRQEELACIKALTTLDLSPALLKELRKALTTRRKKNPAMSAGNRSTTPGDGSNISQRPSDQLACKRKANKLSSLGDSAPQFLVLGPRPCPRLHQVSRMRKLQFSVGNSDPPRGR